MFSYFKLIVKSFFDFKFTNEFAKNGKGSGTGLLAFLSFILAFVISARLVFAIAFINKDEVKDMVLSSIRGMPEVVIMNGELQWENGVVQKFGLPNGITVTVDTQNDDPEISKIKSASIYMTKSNIYVNQSGKTQNASFKDIQALSDKNPLVLTSDENISTIVQIMIYVLWSFVMVGFVFGFLLLWTLSAFLAFIARLIAVKVKSSLADVESDHVRRIAALSMVPVFTLMVALKYFSGQPNSLIAWALVTIAFAVALMTQYADVDSKKAK